MKTGEGNNESIFLVTLQALDMSEERVTFADNGWELSVRQPNLKEALGGVRLGEPLVITVDARYDNLSDPYVLTAVSRVVPEWRIARNQDGSPCFTDD